MTTISNRRSLCIVPTLWQQDLVSGKDAPQLAESVRSMSIRARAAWPHHWFHDRSLYDINFEVDLLETKLDEQRLPELEGAIGVLKYHSSLTDRPHFESEKAFISGGLRIHEELFSDLWERVKQRVVFPCDIRLDVDGLTRDHPLMADDYWDVTSQPKLAVFRVNFCFYTEQANPPLSEGVNS